MKKRLLTLAYCSILAIASFAQHYIEGSCGKDVAWSYDGKTLTIKNVSKKGELVEIGDYGIKNHIAPWKKEKLDIRTIHIGAGITAIGSCAFAGLDRLVEVTFEENSVESIGWGAFLNCGRLSSFSMPTSVRSIGTIAFANCRSLNSIKIPDQCHVKDQAYLNCSNVRYIEVSPTANLGQYVFAGETVVDGQTRHTLYNHEIRRLPAQINDANCHVYGFAKEVVARYKNNNGGANNSIDYDYTTSEVDSLIPENVYNRSDIYALIIGNQNYRFVSEVPYAIHDARIFKEYCEKTLGIPNENIHLVEDATKQLIQDEEMGWLGDIANRNEKRLIVYYAGHGVPDTKEKNKAYLLPTDVRGTNPQYGIALDDLYSRLGDLAFEQTTVFLDACFSGISRDNESVNEGLRGVEIVAEEGELSTGNVVVFSAAQGNETAQGLQEEGHGLFTYYLLKELRESTDGVIFYGNLADNIKRNVSQRALRLKMRKSQTPSTNASENIGDTWRNMTF